MIERKNIVTISEDQKELMQIAQWRFDSHWWVEGHPGYLKCRWCGLTHTSTQSVSSNYPICPHHGLIDPKLPGDRERLIERNEFIGRYHCRNGAYHTGMCCDTCWNGHPEAKKDESFRHTDRCSELLKEAWINRARIAGFNKEQSEFLYEYGCNTRLTYKESS